MINLPPIARQATFPGAQLSIMNPVFSEPDISRGRDHAMAFELLKTQVIEGGYCIGCGVCSYLSNNKWQMKLNAIGSYQPVSGAGGDVIASTVGSVDPLAVCPFSNESRNENQIGRELYSGPGSFRNGIGYYIASYAGYVAEGDFHQSGSSGGLGSWLPHELLSRGLVDAVIHVKQSAGAGSSHEPLFQYEVSHSLEEIRAGAKSRYYPIELSAMLAEVKAYDLRYAFVGLPCMVKSVRLLATQDPEIGRRIAFTIGLVCGHLKTSKFAQYISWQLDVKPAHLKTIDFRKKNESGPAYDYSVQVDSLSSEEPTIKRNYSLYGMDWGMGFFKYSACEFCDDVLAETADATVGDAWLPGHTVGLA